LCCLQCFDTVVWVSGRASSLYKWGDGRGGHWLVQMEWRPAGWSVCLPLLIFPCTIKSGSSLLAPAHPGGPGKMAIKWLWYSIFRPHRSTTYVDAACCYRPSSVVCQSVCHTSDPCKVAAPIEMPFGLRTRVGPGNHVFDGVQIPHGKRQFWGGKGHPIVKYREILRSSVLKRLNQLRCRLGCGLGCAQGIMC